MTRETIMRAVAKVAAELGANLDTATSEERIQMIVEDSILFLELVVRLEQELGVQLADTDVYDPALRNLNVLADRLLASPR